MLYKIAHLLSNKLPCVWGAIEKGNEWLFLLLYERKLRKVSIKSLPDGYCLVEMRNANTEKIVEFFQKQPNEAFKFFNPHKFDSKCIKQLQNNKSYIAYLLIDKENGKIAGYCFNRCYFIGKGFRGRMVDIDYRGRGLGTAMNKILNEVGFGLGLRLYETVSKDNLASYRSALTASNVRVVEELPHNELYLEILPN